MLACLLCLSQQFDVRQFFVRNVSGINQLRCLQQRYSHFVYHPKQAVNQHKLSLGMSNAQHVLLHRECMAKHFFKTLQASGAVSITTLYCSFLQREPAKALNRSYDWFLSPLLFTPRKLELNVADWGCDEKLYDASCAVGKLA